MAFRRKNQTILSSKRDWDEWIRPIKAEALGSDVWKYINPDLTTANGKTLIEPEVPKKAPGESEADFQFRRDIYRAELKRYHAYEALIGLIRKHIFLTIDSSAERLIQDTSNVRDILIDLQKRYKPDANQVRFDIRRKWTSLKAGPPRKSQLREWTNSWIETQIKACEYEIPGIGTSEKHAMMDFIFAIEKSYPRFYSSYIEAVKLDPDQLFVELIGEFERFSESTTFEGSNTDSNKSNRKKSSKEERPCPCGQSPKVHTKWRDCQYRNENLRVDGWTPDLKILEKVAEAAARFKPLQNFIQRNKKTTEYRPIASVNTVYLMINNNELANSVIYYSGPTESISNDRNRIENFAPERIEVRGFGGSIWSKGRGTMIVWATAPGGEEKSERFSIRNALYCPDSPVSLVSGQALNRNGIFKDDLKNVLHSRKGGYTAIATLQLMHGQPVIEYNPPNP